MLSGSHQGWGRLPEKSESAHYRHRFYSQNYTLLLSKENADVSYGHCVDYSCAAVPGIKRGALDR